MPGNLDTLKKEIVDYVKSHPRQSSWSLDVTHYDREARNEILEFLKQPFNELDADLVYDLSSMDHENSITLTIKFKSPNNLLNNHSHLFSDQSQQAKLMLQDLEINIPVDDKAYWMHISEIYQTALGLVVLLDPIVKCGGSESGPGLAHAKHSLPIANVDAPLPVTYCLVSDEEGIHSHYMGDHFVHIASKGEVIPPKAKCLYNQDWFSIRENASMEDNGMSENESASLSIGSRRS